MSHYTLCIRRSKGVSDLVELGFFYILSKTMWKHKDEECWITDEYIIDSLVKFGRGKTINSITELLRLRISSDFMVEIDENGDVLTKDAEKLIENVKGKDCSYVLFPGRELPLTLYSCTSGITNLDRAKFIKANQDILCNTMIIPRDYMFDIQQKREERAIQHWIDNTLIDMGVENIETD